MTAAVMCRQCFLPRAARTNRPQSCCNRCGAVN
jgi:hypothetical protein